MIEFEGHLKAWTHFYDYIRQSPVWKDIPQNERKRIYDANADAKRQRKKGLGYERAKNILNKYAPGKYEFRETVIFHEEK